MSSKVILVVDDEADVRQYFSSVLEDAGYVVKTACNGQEALEFVAQEKPALVSLDISMPETSGVRFYREMRDNPELATIPIVIVTGVTSPLGASDGRGSFEQFISSRKQVPPPDGFFDKPVDPEAFVAKVEELLGAASN